MTTAAQVLEVARRDIGTVEDPAGSTPFHRAYGLPPGQPWCAVWVWDVFRRATAGGLIHPKTAYTPTLAAWFRVRGSFTANPAPGDLVFYDWPDQMRRIQHVGIVEAVERDAIITLEGNTTAPAGRGDQSDGGGVWRRRRARGPAIAGYGRPAYSPAPPAAPPTAAAARQEDTMPTPLDIAAAVWAYGLKNGWGDVVQAQQILVGAEIRAAGTQAQLQQLTGLVTQLRAGGVDPAAIEQAVRAALGRGLTVAPAP